MSQKKNKNTHTRSCACANKMSCSAVCNRFFVEHTKRHGHIRFAWQTSIYGGIIKERWAGSEVGLHTNTGRIENLPSLCSSSRIHIRELRSCILNQRVVKARRQRNSVRRSAKVSQKLCLCHFIPKTIKTVFAERLFARCCTHLSQTPATLP